MTTINRLSSVDALQPGDLIPVWDTSNGDPRKASLGTLLGFIEANYADPDYETRVLTPLEDFFTVTAGNTGTSLWLIINPVTAFTTGTLQLPPASSATNDQEITVVFTAGVTDLTVASAGATVLGAPIRIGAYDSFRVRYNAGQLKWYTLDTTGDGSGSVASILRQDFAGDGVTTNFTLAVAPPAFGETLQIFIDGVYQERAGYSIAGAFLIFSAPPPNGTVIEVLSWDALSSGTTTADLVGYNRDSGGVLTTVSEELDRTTTINVTAYELGTTAAASSHAGIATGYIIRTNYFDSARTSGSGAEYSFTGVTTLGKAGNWPDADGYFYDVDGKQFAVVGSPVNVLWFGARSSAADNLSAIQSTIEYVSAIGGGVVFVPNGTYLLSSVTYPGSGAAGVSSILMRDGVTLRGESHEAVLKAQDSLYGLGALYRMITSLGYVLAEAGLSNAYIENLTVDGNAANQVASTQCSNIQMHPLTNVHVKNVRSIGCNGNGIMLNAPVGNIAENISITDCDVSDCTSIGIQVSQFDRLLITRNRVDNCVNNAIDIYGENGTATATGGDFTISNNICSNSLTGIFPETVKNGIITNNVISDCTSSGIHSNRINGAPSGLSLLTNFIRNCPIGIYMTGDNDQIFVSGNSVNDCAIGLQCGTAGGNSSQITATGNYFDGFTFCFKVAVVNISFVRFVNNYSKTLAVNTTISETVTGTKTACNFDAPVPQQSSERYGSPVNYDVQNVANTVTIPSYFRNSGGGMQTYAQEIWGSPNTSGGSTEGSYYLEVRASGTMTRVIGVNGNRLGFYAKAPIAKPTVTGAKGGNAALTSLIAAMVGLGLITDSTT